MRLTTVLLSCAMLGLNAIPASAQTQWVYGDHPVLGLSAHVDLEDGGAIGLACHEPQYNPMMDSFVALRVTDDQLTDGGFTLLFDGADDARTLTAASSRPGEGYGEWVGNTCETLVLAFQRSNSLISTPASISGFGAQNGEFDFIYSGTTVRASRADGYEGLPGRRITGLQGSSAAIGQLIAACPSIRMDIADNCGI